MLFSKMMEEIFNSNHPVAHCQRDTWQREIYTIFTKGNNQFTWFRSSYINFDIEKLIEDNIEFYLPDDDKPHKFHDIIESLKAGIKVKIDSPCSEEYIFIMKNGGLAMHIIEEFSGVLTETDILANDWELRFPETTSQN